MLRSPAYYIHLSAVVAADTSVDTSVADRASAVVADTSAADTSVVDTSAVVEVSVDIPVGIPVAEESVGIPVVEPVVDIPADIPVAEVFVVAW